MNTEPITKSRLAEMVAALRAKKAAALASDALINPSPEIIAKEALVKVAEAVEATDRFGKLIEYNGKQQEFVDLADSGESAILIGAAGTGKTTCMKGVVSGLIQNGRAGLLTADGHKHLLDGSPGIVVCAYTRRAVANIRKNMPEDMRANCVTIHKLLEYQPVYDTVTNEETGAETTKMSFQPARDRFHPLPPSIHTIIFEESSMIGTDLYKEVRDACPHSPQEIFLGDIQQLPPVFGPAILGFKLLELPTVELTEVYRQALESPIIRLAHRILSGKGIEPSELGEWKIPGQLTIHPWKKKIKDDVALNTTAQFFIKAHSENQYDPEEDIILLPFNKSFGTLELNNKIANHLARSRGAVTYQVIAGFNRFHFSPGDKVLYDKEDATIISIETNPVYSGANPARESTTLDYWGCEQDSQKMKDQANHGPMSDDDMDLILANTVSGGGSEDKDRVRQCSHILTLQMNDSDVEIKVSKASEVNAMLLGYALTVHKSQGSEWRKVFFVCHQSHATMLQRELLYTAVTRAKEELYIICEPETFVNGITSQRVKGDTLSEKAEFFKGKLTGGFRLYEED